MKKIIANHPEIEKLVNGDKKTLKSLYTVLFPKISFFILKNSGQKKDAEEIFQNALFQLIVRAKTNGIEIKSSFEAYVFTVCKNLWLKELNNRKGLVRNDGVLELKVETTETIESILNQERWDLFEEKLTLLTDKCKLLLKDFFNKVPYREIVKKFKYSCENVAFQRVFKCKKRLADLIKADVNYTNLVS